MPKQKIKQKNNNPAKKLISNGTKPKTLPLPKKELIAPARVWNRHMCLAVFLSVAIGLLAVFSVAFAEYGWTQVAGNGPSAVASAGESLPEASTAENGLVPRRLDGALVKPDQANFWPYAAMIENLLSTRPQSGLSQAAVVYETLAEGGSTRFMAVFDPSEIIPEIMPVRSARPYYIEWVSEYAALYAHAGGSPKALTVIWENKDINNLDALSRNGKYFWRDKSKGAPHNLVTSSDKMNFALRDLLLLDKAATFRSWLFKGEALPVERGADAKSVEFNFSTGKTYLVRYQYDQASNSYFRFNANAPHLDKNTSQQITVKNVVVQLVREPGYDNTGKGRLDIYVGGTGTAWIFVDGQVTKGTWQKNSRTDRTVFFNENGAEVSFNRGNTWVHVVPEDQAVTYQ
ncbi:MAG: DUF3048 domain-containing protein [Patescibacteria group bacterium]